MEVKKSTERKWKQMLKEKCSKRWGEVKRILERSEKMNKDSKTSPADTDVFKASSGYLKKVTTSYE